MVEYKAKEYVIALLKQNPKKTPNVIKRKNTGLSNKSLLPSPQTEKIYDVTNQREDKVLLYINFNGFNI